MDVFGRSVIFLIGIVIRKSLGENLVSLTYCDTSAVHLSCPFGTIDIRKVFYGDRREVTCATRSGKARTFDCDSENAEKIVNESCNNTAECVIKFNDINSGLPGFCVGKNIYLKLEYTCGNFYEKTICENTEGTLQCDANKVIYVVSAFYGRKDKTTCGNTPNWDDYCSNNQTLDIVSTKCNNKIQCKLIVNNMELKSDPCTSIHKYLTVKYNCVDLDQRLKSINNKIVTICEHTEGTLQCDDNKVIDVVGGFYGRQDKTTCGNNPNWNDYCSNNQALYIVSAKCNKKQECILEANNEKMKSDPCPKIPKYMIVEYDCV